jgi:hypothetical protein
MAKHKTKSMSAEETAKAMLALGTMEAMNLAASQLHRSWYTPRRTFWSEVQDILRRSLPR